MIESITKHRPHLTRSKNKNTLSQMQPLKPPDLHHFNAAIGWLELGALADARTELNAISPVNQAHPGVLELCWMICAAGKQWDEALVVAEKIQACLPDEPSGWLHRAYAMRRVESGDWKKHWQRCFQQRRNFPRSRSSRLTSRVTPAS